MNALLSAYQQELSLLPFLISVILLSAHPRPQRTCSRQLEREIGLWPWARGKLNRGTWVWPVTHTASTPHSKSQAAMGNQHWLKHFVYKWNKPGQPDKDLFKSSWSHQWGVRNLLDRFLGCPLKQSTVKLRTWGTFTSDTSSIQYTVTEGNNNLKKHADRPLSDTPATPGLDYLPEMHKKEGQFVLRNCKARNPILQNSIDPYTLAIHAMIQRYNEGIKNQR